MRWRGKWTWHQDPLTVAFALWAFAIGCSLVANLDLWRRIVIGIWFALLYFGLWSLLHDSITNKRLKRETLIDSMLLSSIPVLIIGYAQLWYWFTNWLQLANIGNVTPFDIPRLSSTLVNPNVLAAFLVSLIPLALMRFMTANKLGRILLGLYFLLAVILLIITDSRGGWIALAVGLGVFGVLLLAHHQMLSAPKLRTWYAARSVRWKWAIATASVFIVVGGLVMMLSIVHSLSDASRTVELRTYIYDIAIKVFKEKPIAGEGLFTFGRSLLQYASTPPETPHSNAHDLPLNVAAETGLFGLLSLTVSIVVVVRAMWRNWQIAKGQQRILLIGCIASTSGFAVHHLLDLPASGTPIVYIIGMITLLIAVTPLRSVQIGVAWQRLQNILVISVWFVVIVVGFWAAALYSDYVEALRNGIASSDYSGAAAQLEKSIQRDPNNPIYYLYQGYFLALAGFRGDVVAARQAVAAYERFCELEPYYAPAWANLSSLYWQLGERAQAVDAMKHAAQIAPQAWNYQFNLGLYLEMTGQLEEGRRSYLDTLALNPDASLYPEWKQSPLRRALAAQNEAYSAQAKIIYLLADGDINGAQQLWERLPASEADTETALVIEEVLALSRGDKKVADLHLQLAIRASTDAENDPWIRAGRAEWAQATSNQGLATQERDMARSILAANSITDDVKISAISYAQYWSLGIFKYSLPSVYAPDGDPLITAILERGLDEF